MTGRLAGKVAEITGGTSGVGETTGELLLAECAKVISVERNTNKKPATVTAARHEPETESGSGRAARPLRVRSDRRVTPPSNEDLSALCYR